MKQCTKCKKILDFSFYSKDIQKKDKLRPSCKICNSKAITKEILKDGYKKCSKCNKVLLKIFFDKDKTKPEGLYSSCKNCRADSFGVPLNRRCKPIGTKIITAEGYIRIAGKNNREHRLVMEEFLGRKLLSSEYVHHKDGDKTNNNINNLEIISASEHAKHHFPEIKEKFSYAYRKYITKNCQVCNKKYITKSYQRKYCSKKCLRITRKEYYKQWFAKRKLLEA